jgi:hypothetical protein
MDSILTSIKKLLGIAEEYTQFDADIIIHINSVFLTLLEIGVGPLGGFFITDAGDKWTDFIADDPTLLNAVKSYMFLKVKMLFDPSLTSSVTDLMKEEVKELEWRLNVYADPQSVLEAWRNND